MSTTANEFSIIYNTRYQNNQLTGRLQAGTANKETVNIGLLGELAAVLLADGATVDDTDLVLSLGGDGLTEPLADSGVDILGLLGGSDLAGADGPMKKRKELDATLNYIVRVVEGSLTRRARRQRQP